jgi:hypothetical protein
LLASTPAEGENSRALTVCCLACCRVFAQRQILLLTEFTAIDFDFDHAVQSTEQARDRIG